MPWYGVTRVENGVATLRISDEIGYDWWTDDGLAAKEFTAIVDSLGDLTQINLHINSPGGNVYDGLEIYNYLKRHPANVNVYVDGIAGSIASVIAMVSENRIMPSNTQMMIHNPGAWLERAYMEADDLRGMADQLDRVKSSIITIYTEATGMQEDQLWDLMSNETLMTAAEAVDMGFATEVEATVNITNKFNLKDIKQRVGKIENKVPSKNPKGAPPQTQDPVNLAEQVTLACNDAGFPALAAGFIRNKFTLDSVTSKLETAKGIKNTLKVAGLENSVSRVVDNIDDPLKMLQITVTDLKAEMDQDIDNGISEPDKQKQVKASWAKAFKSKSK